MKIKWDEQGLIPTIVQHATTGEVLMLAYMNEEAYQLTLDTKEAWFYSRSRQELWQKGTTSGNTQQVKSVSLDCDGDTLLLQVEPAGPACHTGNRSCFYTSIQQSESLYLVVHEVADEINRRKQQPEEGSYTTYLFTEGIDKILKKVGEETTEVVIGAKNNDFEEVTNEVADLVYHVLVLLTELNISITDIQRVLKERRKS